MKEKLGRKVLDASSKSLKTMKWMLAIGALIALMVALCATSFSLRRGYFLFSFVFIINAVLFSVAMVFIWLYFSSKEIILYEKGMKIPMGMFSSQYILYDDIISINPYARGGSVKIKMKEISIEISKGYIDRWDEFLEVMKKKGFINEN